MAKFSKRSEEKLLTCDPRLQDLFRYIVKIFDCTITEGHRGEEKQNKYYENGTSKIKYPNGKHNSIPSKAVDVIPYPVDYDDIERICYFAGFVMGIAKIKGIPLRWGKDWDGDTDLNDQTFKDGPYFELID